MAKLKNILFFFTIILLVALAGCRTVPSKEISTVHLKDLCELYDISWQLDSVSQVVTLHKGSKDAKVIIGSDIVLMGAEKIHLSEPLKRQKGTILVPADFKTKVINHFVEEAICNTVVVPKKPYKIIVDAGHGGKDPGTTGRLGTREKDIVLDIAKRLKTDLERSGFEVKMTRDRDEFISLEQRTEIASNSDADLFVSVHANSSPSRSIQGVEVYTMRPLDYKEKTEEQRVKNHRILFNHLSMERNQSSLDETLSDMLFNSKCAESPRLASYASKGICKQAKADSRGVKRAGFFVLRNTLIPAILVEVGFLSNGREERLLQTDEYRQKIADGLADSISGYVSVR